MIHGIPQTFLLRSAEMTREPGDIVSTSLRHGDDAVRAIEQTGMLRTRVRDAA
jgi:hypothetical protein